MTDSIRTALLGLIVIFACPIVMAKDKTTCAKRALENKDCHLSAGKLTVHLFKDKIIVSDDIHRGLSDLPYTGQNVTWHAARLRQLAKRPILELELWSPPSGEIGVESLGWYVYEIKSGEPSLRIDHVVQKRRLISTEPKKYKYDQSKDHGLSVKANKIYWKSGRDQGELEPTRSPNDI